MASLYLDVFAQFILRKKSAKTVETEVYSPRHLMSAVHFQRFRRCYPNGRALNDTGATKHIEPHLDGRFWVSMCEMQVTPSQVSRRSFEPWWLLRTWPIASASDSRRRSWNELGGIYFCPNQAERQPMSHIWEQWRWYQPEKVSDEILILWSG